MARSQRSDLSNNSTVGILSPNERSEELSMTRRGHQASIDVLRDFEVLVRRPAQKCYFQ